MSKSKKPKGGRKPYKREPAVWPPEEWPEEARQAEIAAFEAFMAEWWKSVIAGFGVTDITRPPTAEIISFPTDGKGRK